MNIHPRFRPPPELTPTPIPATSGVWLVAMFGFMVSLPLIAYQPWMIFVLPLLAAAGVMLAGRSDQFGFIFLALLPLSLSRHFTTATYEMLPTSIRLLLLVLLILTALMTRAQDSRFTGTALCWGLFLVVVAATTGFLSMYPQVSYLKLGFAAFFLGAMLVMARGPGEYPAIIYGVICGIVVASLIAFVAFPFVGYMFTGGGDALSGRFSGVLAHPQLLSCLVAVSLPLLIYSFVAGQGLQRGWALLVLVLAFGLMFITSSRGGMLAGLVSTVAILVLLIWKPCAPTARQRALGLALVLGAVGLVAAISTADSVRDFIFKNDRADAVSLSGRDEIIGQSWAGFCARPLLGNGFQVPSEFTEHGAATFGSEDNVSIEKCFFLTMILEETGAVGGLFFLAGLGLLLYRAFKSRSFVFVACLLGFLTVNLAEAVIFSPSSLGGLCWLVCFSTHRLRA